MRILLEILTMAPRNTVVSAMAIFTLACAVLLGIPSTGFVAPRALEDSAGKAWTAYVQAQRQLQVEVADFLSSQRPDLKEVIVVSRDLQLGLIDRRSLEFRYLLAKHPEHIIRNQGISQFANFHWTDQDAITLRKSNPDYVAAVSVLKFYGNATTAILNCRPCARPISPSRSSPIIRKFMLDSTSE
jgi:hypothetical protein